MIVGKNLRLFVLLIFLSHFISYVTAFKFKYSVNSQDNEIIYTHTWLIKDFQELYNELGDDSEIYSDPFFTPIPNNQGEHHAWRVSIYIRDKRIGMSLLKFQTDYERQNGLNERRIKFKFEIYLNNKLETHKFLGQSGIGNNLFTKDTVGIGTYVCTISDIFPNDNTSNKINLIVQVHFYEVENINNDNPPNFFKQFEQYFNSDEFNDIIFKFNCESKIRASSIFLAMKSSHFKKLLEVQKDSKEIVIHMKEVSYHCFYKLLYFIYSGKLDNNLCYEELIELYHESNLREINDLKGIISYRILKYVNENTWDELLLLGWKTNNKIIKKAALKFVIDNWTKVKDTDKMREIESLNNIEWLEELIITKIFGN